ncbi:ionotropic receptor 93a-like [Procambarus clarkii]|uniref:ionotropic receptor 93a-like n=1 Tax=Procambarus clarkii TaxID=6728 RepID=UPI0037426ED6
MTESRTEVIDFTWPFTIQYSMIMGARGRPVVDPWGFVLPLEPLVWAAILTALLVLPVVMVLLASCSSVTTPKQYTWGKDIFDLTRILLQQDYRASAIVGWRRLVLVAWMVLGLVVSRSYQGDLMSGLAVRHIRQPFQTIRDVLDHPTITMLWQTNSTNVQYFRAVESGIFREVAEAETKSRVKYKLLSEFPQAINTLVRRGDHVLIDLEIVITMIIGQYFTHTGRCDFYSSRERFLPMVLSMIGQRDSPLVPALSKRIMSFSEAGLYEQWFKDTVPNATSCVHPPSKIAVSTSLSLANLWVKVNCISCVPRGMALDLAKKYPHSNAYNVRRPLYSLKRCIPEDRPVPGTIHISKGENLPYIVAIATQYGIGLPIESNNIAQGIIEKSKDRNMLVGIKEDTSINRLVYFNNGMKDLFNFNKDSPQIMRVIIPTGIERTCVQRDEVRENTYLPVIQDMYKHLKPYGVEIKLLFNEEIMQKKSK